MSHLRARYYDPSAGQFISRDPAVASTREPYAHSYDNPLNLTDLSGLDSWAGGFQLGWEAGKTTPIGLPWDSKDGTVGVDNWQHRWSFQPGGIARSSWCGWNDNPDQVLNTFHK